jgi:hypothetical protein
LLTVVHPWETGCDDSPRFDHWGAANRSRWYDAKGALVASVTRGPDGSPLANDAFGCAPAGFNALVAWNARELAALTGDRSLAEPAAELAGALSYRWDPERATWADAGPSAGDSGRTRTAEGLLAVLVDPARLTEVRRVIADPAGFGGPFGPTGVHRGEAAYNPERYWRGPVWPQLAYLLAVAGVDEVRAGTVAGARASGFAEYWHPEDGRGLGAIPQSWTGLCLLLARDGA